VFTKDRQGKTLLPGTIESSTSKLPSSLFLGLAVGSMAASLSLKLIGKDNWARSSLINGLRRF
jgi:hypothetical protein